MADENWTVGDQARIKAGLYRRINGDRFYYRGQLVELTEEDLDRSDFDFIFEDPEENDPDAPEEVEETGSEAVDFSDPSEEELLDLLKGMNADEAKKFASNERWTANGMSVMIDAETAGRNRSTVISYMHERLTDLQDEEESGLPS